jgi:hypothetical protein
MLWWTNLQEKIILTSVHCVFGVYEYGVNVAH